MKMMISISAGEWTVARSAAAIRPPATVPPTRCSPFWNVVEVCGCRTTMTLKSTQ